MQDTGSINDLADTLIQLADISFELLDPEDEQILESDLQQRLKIAWQAG